MTHTHPPAPDDERPEGHQPEAVRATITLLQRRGIEAEVLIPLIRRMEQEIGRDAAHRIARDTINEIAREQGQAVAEALARDDLEGFHHVKDTWSGAGGDLQVETLREDAEALEFNVTGCRFAEMFRRMGAEDLGFILSCGRDFALSEGYSEGLHLERTQTIMQGAPFCDFRYRLAAHAPAPPDVTVEDAADAPATAPAPAAEAAPPPPPTDAERLEEQAARVGGMLGRMAKKLAARAKPEMELRARQARAAAEAARPHVERAAQSAKEYVQTHDQEILRAAETGARFAADRVIPPTIRPLVNAAEQELRRGTTSDDDAPNADADAPAPDAPKQPPHT